jgi:hypothetical protein
MSVTCYRYEAPHNVWNGCLDLETGVWLQIQMRGGLRMLCPAKRYPEPPWVKMPLQGKRFSEIKSIALPANDGLDHVVGSFIVPTGYDGVIQSVVFQYTGQGFNEGSGDLTFRIQKNQYYVKDYGAVTTQIASMTQPYNGVTTGQILILSCQLVQLIVNRSVASGGNINGGRVIMSAFGWYYPR